MMIVLNAKFDVVDSKRSYFNDFYFAKFQNGNALKKLNTADTLAGSDNSTLRNFKH